MIRVTSDQIEELCKIAYSEFIKQTDKKRIIRDIPEKWDDLPDDIKNVDITAMKEVVRLNEIQ